MEVDRIILLLGLIGVAENQANTYDDGVASTCEKWKWVFVLSPAANEINRLIELVESARSAIVKRPKSDNDDVYVTISPEDFESFRQKSRLLKVYKSHTKKCVASKKNVSSNVVTSTITSRSTKKWKKSKPTSIVSKASLAPASLASKSPSLNTTREITDKACKCTQMLRNESNEKLANDSWSNPLENFTEGKTGRKEQVKNKLNNNKNIRSNNSSKQNSKKIAMNKNESAADRPTKNLKGKDHLKGSRSEHRRSSKGSRRTKRAGRNYARENFASYKSPRCHVIRITTHCGGDDDETNEDQATTPMLDISVDEPVDTYPSKIAPWQPSVTDKHDDSIDVSSPRQSTVTDKPADSIADLFPEELDSLLPIEIPPSFQEDPEDDSYDFLQESDPMDESFFAESLDPFVELPNYSPDTSRKEGSLEFKDYKNSPPVLLGNEDNDSVSSEIPKKGDTLGVTEKSFWPLGTQRFSEKSDSSENQTDKVIPATSSQTISTGKSVSADIHGTINQSVNDVDNDGLSKGWSGEVWTSSDSEDIEESTLITNASDSPKIVEGEEYFWDTEDLSETDDDDDDNYSDEGVTLPDIYEEESWPDID